MDEQCVRLAVSMGCPEQPAGEASLASLYRQRAAVLALPQAGASTQPAQGGTILFQLGNETYGLPMHAIDRVYSKPVRRHVPGAGSRWAGVFAVQGEIVPILDLARILNLPEAQGDSDECVFTLRGVGRKLGLLVGKTLEIREIPAESLQPAGGQARFLKGVSRDNALVLDIELLTVQEFSR
jgi:purine-binding chemotaxis protein CheW